MRTDILEQKEQILKWIEEKQTKAFMCQQLRCKPETLNSYMKQMGIEYKGQPSKKGQYKGGKEYLPALYYIENHIPISSHKLKNKLIRDGIKEDKCALCGVSTWLDVKLPLELHHKDGNHYNNELSNLDILCPNCHSIQESNSGANAGNYAVKRDVAEQRKNFCIDCQTEISLKATRCKSCASKEKQKEKVASHPSRDELKKLIRTTSFCQIGRLYGVSDNAVRKWCDGYKLPRKVSDIKNISEAEWEKI